MNAAELDAFRQKVQRMNRNQLRELTYQIADSTMTNSRKAELIEIISNPW